MTPGWRVWRLRSQLSVLLVVATLLPFALVGGAMLAYRIPQIERASQLALQEEVEAMRVRMEQLMGTRQARVHVLASLPANAPAGQAERIFDDTVEHTKLALAIYRLSSLGRVEVAGLAPALRAQRQALQGRDLSSLAAFQSVANGAAAAWSGVYASAVTGTRCVAVAVRSHDGRVLLAEVPFEAVRTVAQVAAGHRSSTVWIAKRNGEVVSDTGTDPGRVLTGFNLQALTAAALTWGASTQTLRFEGHTFHAAVSRAPALDWDVVGLSPTGWDNPDVRGSVVFALTSLAGCLLVGLLIAPFWASRLARPLQQIVRHAARTSVGESHTQAWPRGPVTEFNRLAGDLETMAATLRERERKSQAIFNASPVPMVVVTADDALVIRDVNEAWCRVLLRDREQVIGRRVVDTGLMRSRQELEQALAEAQDGRISTDVWQVRGDGQEILLQTFGGKTATLKAEQVAVWAFVEIGSLRRIERELQELNQQLSSRVALRTHALAASNEALSQTVEQLRAAQDELVRAEKLAALGQLVAGVAHELNTPLGNGVMSVSAMADATRGFKAALQKGLRRADLDQFVESVTQGADIAGRNLRRAADLVQSFKQVAVDQTSSQRRGFELSEIVSSIVVSLRPSFHLTPYRIEVDVPETGLRLDSYPGALGQALTNLIQNAVVHGFDGRDHGVVRVTGTCDTADGRIVLRVADDGRGIPAAVLPHVFEPFVTTKMGHGGTGLGLHISYNAVVDLMGGTLTASSLEGQGAVFEMRLPPQAPGA